MEDAGMSSRPALSRRSITTNPSFLNSYPLSEVATAAELAGSSPTSPAGPADEAGEESKAKDAYSTAGDASAMPSLANFVVSQKLRSRKKQTASFAGVSTSSSAVEPSSAPESPALVRTSSSPASSRGAKGSGSWNGPLCKFEEPTETPSPVEILFVDDCRIQRKLVPRLMEPLGIQVIPVESGEAAMEWLATRFRKKGPARFPVVILQDLHMPTPMSGRDTARAFRQTYPDLPTPIIAYTADDDESIVPGLLEDGFTDYVAKMPGCRGLKARLQVRVLYAPSPRLANSFSNMKIAKDNDTDALSSPAAGSDAGSLTPRPSEEIADLAENAVPLRTPSFSGSVVGSDTPSETAAELPEILLVDDDRIQRKIVPKVLEKIGVKVTAIDSGDSAVMMLRARFKRKGPESFPSIIILDLHMPGMSGIETARAIRERFPDQKLPIIAFTGDEDESIVPALMDAGFSDYVAKLPQCRGLRARIQVQLHLIEIQKRITSLVGQDEKLKDVLPGAVLNNIRHGSQTFESVTVTFIFIYQDAQLRDEFPESAFADIDRALLEKLTEETDKHSLHMVQDAGGFMIIAGCNEASSKDHTNRALDVANTMMSYACGLKLPNGKKTRLQVGIHTGSAHAGLVGVRDETFCFFGDTVSIARHIAQSGYPDCLNISAVAHGVHMCLPPESQKALIETPHSVIIVRNWK